MSAAALRSLVAVIAGLPPTAWLMILAAGGIGLGIELVFYARYRGRYRRRHGGRWSGRRGDPSR